MLSQQRSEPYISDNPFRLLSLDSLTPFARVRQQAEQVSKQLAAGIPLLNTPADSASVANLSRITEITQQLLADIPQRTIHRILWYSGEGIHIGSKWDQFLQNPANTQLLKTALWDLNNFHVNTRLASLFTQQLQDEDPIDAETAERHFQQAVDSLSDHIATRAAQVAIFVRENGQEGIYTEITRILSDSPLPARAQPQENPLTAPYTLSDYDIEDSPVEVQQFEPDQKRYAKTPSIGWAIGGIGIMLAVTLFLLNRNTKPDHLSASPSDTRQATETSPTPEPAVSTTSSEDSELNSENSFADDYEAKPLPIFDKISLEAQHKRLRADLETNNNQLREAIAGLKAMEKDLDNQDAELKRRRSSLNRRSSSAVRRFNARVRAYNALRERYLEKRKQTKKKIAEQGERIKLADDVMDQLEPAE